MSKESKRIEFSSKVKRTIFNKVNGRCSVPRCKNPTLGPSKENEGYINQGEACHIYSASKNGPRGWGDKDKDFIGSESNGLWCCKNHASLIDKKSGTDYTVEELFAWKNLAEARALKEMNDQPSPLGWIDSIELTSFPVLEKLPKAILSRNTILFGGKNGRGVSTLLEMVATLSDSNHSDRFIRPVGNKEDCTKEAVAALGASIIYTTVDVFDKKIDIRIEGQEVLKSENHTNYLLPPDDLEVILYADKGRRKSEDDIDYLMRVLNVDRSTMYRLINYGASTMIKGDMKVESVELENDEEEVKNNGKPYMELFFRLNHNQEFPNNPDSLDDKFRCYESFSPSEKKRLQIEFFILKARETCKHKLTLFLIEDIASLDSNNFKKLLETLQQEDFQSVLVLPYNLESDILEVSKDCKKLKSLDYLAPWKLVML